MNIFGLGLRNQNILRATTKTMAVISRIFSLLTLLAMIFDLALCLLTIDPYFFLGGRLSRNMNLSGLHLNYQLTCTGNCKNMLSIQYGNALNFVSIVPYAILYWALNEATKFFKIIAQGNSFDKNEAGHVRHLAWGAFLYCITFHGLMPTISSLISIVNAQHASIYVSPIDMNFSLAGLVHISISWIGLLLLVCIGALVVVAEIIRRASIIAEDYAKIV